MSRFKPLPIVVETSDYIVINKPYDICINGEQERKAHGDTVASILQEERPDSVDSSVCSGFRFPHQLDYATSGALCITLNRETTREAARLFKERKVVKEYLALVHGHVIKDTQILNTQIGQDSRDTTGFAMTSNQAHCVNPKPAESYIDVLARGSYKGKPATKICVRPVTGRRHQIRVHCSTMGHPIIGDYTYSGKTDTEPHRMMLHSWKLKIPLEKDPLDITTLDPFEYYVFNTNYNNSTKENEPKK